MAHIKSKINKLSLFEFALFGRITIWVVEKVGAIVSWFRATHVESKLDINLSATNDRNISTGHKVSHPFINQNFILIHKIHFKVIPLILTGLNWFGSLAPLSLYKVCT